MLNKPDALVFFDLDGTLFTRDVAVAKSTIVAINALIQNNIKPVIATGRSACEVKHVMDETGIDSIIGMNGQSVIYENTNIFLNTIDSELITKVVEFSKNETGIPLSFYNDNAMYVSQSGMPVTKLYHYLKQTVPPINPDIYKFEAIQMLLLLCEKGEDIYQAHFPELKFIRNTPYCVDVFNHGGSKAYGIKKLLENKHFHDVPTYAFGDGLNDLEMFQIVDHPIAMANGVEQLKSIAEFVTDDNNNDGITKGLIKVGLI
ncbi:Cof-type HAD-IIB family hydrolase [Orbaceae bacterium ac157xtp]